MLTRPAAGDYATYFQGYIDRVPDGDVMTQLAAQGLRMQQLLSSVSEAQGDFSYAPGKWTVKRLALHIADGERMFCYRAMCLARGDQQELPGFDENAYAEHDGSADRTLASIIEEYVSVRAATLTLFAGFGEAAWSRRGIANGNPVTVASLPWIITGHDLHHFAMLQERYGLQLA
jgi:hypothetical protein